MRALSTGDEARLRAGTYRARVEVRDTGGTWRDLSTLPTFNAIKSVAWGEDVDSPGLTASLTFFRNLDAISLSPLHDTSPVNRTTPFDPGGSFVALLAVNRRLRISWALLAEAGEVPSWVVAFDGLVTSYDLSDDETISVECRGQFAELQDRFFEEEFVFAFGGSLQAGPFRVWQPNTAYALNDKVIPTDSKRNGKFYATSTAGTSGATEPTWPGAGTVASGTAVFTYSATTSPAGGYPVQQVIAELALSMVPAGTAVFGDLASTTIALFTPVSPGWAINAFQVPRENVWGEMQNLAQQIGWDLRWKWDPAYSQFRLSLTDPNRSKTTADRVMQFGLEVRGYASVGSSIENIRNAVGVVYSDAGDLTPANTPKRKKTVRVDSASVALYGRRYMEVGEGSASNVDSTAEANAMGDAILSDLSQPVADLSVEMRFFPWVELADLYDFPPDGRRFTVSQKLAVTSYRHTIDGSTYQTIVDVRGKPSTGNRRWAAVATENNPIDNHRLQNFGAGSAPVTTATPNLRGAVVSVDDSPVIRALPRSLEQHVSATSGFTPSASTLKGIGQKAEFTVVGLKPGRTHYAKTVPFSWNAQRLVRGEPSEETSFVPGYVEPVDLNPDTVPQPLPPNGSFEGWFEGDSVPPDHWEADTGTWADWARATTAGDGAYSIEARDLGSSVRAELRSVWFPAEAGKTYALRAMLQRVASDGDVRLTIEWGDSAKASLSSDTLTTNTAGMTNFTASRELVAEAPAGTRFARVKVGRDTASTLRFRADAVSLRCVGEAIVAPTYSDGNWSDYGGGFTGVGYWRDALGLIHLRGLALTAVARAIGVTIFTLPAGFRPTAQEIFAQHGPGGLVRVDVAAAGNVYLQTALNAADWVSLSGIILDTR